jgi:Holliday junction resolvase RusA-like endonuclease
MTPLAAAINAALDREAPVRAAVASLTLTLPVPPSLNNAFANAGDRRVIAGPYASWRRAAGWCVQTARAPRVAGPFAVDFDFWRHLPGDLDNRIKGLLDLFVAHKITDDDRACDEFHVYRRFAKPGMVLVTVRQHAPMLTRPVARGVGSAAR